MTSMADVDTDTVQILKLDKKSPHQIAMTIREFRNGMTTGMEGEKGSGASAKSDLATKVQNHFMAVNSIVFPARPEVDGAADVCL
jgi:hypothetical protein